jgi:hypothetical protein
MRGLQSLSLLASLAAAQVQQPLAAPELDKAEKRPNILFVLTDDQVHQSCSLRISLWETG